MPFRARSQRLLKHEVGHCEAPRQAAGGLGAADAAGRRAAEPTTNRTVQPIVAGTGACATAPVRVAASWLSGRRRHFIFADHERPRCRPTGGGVEMSGLAGAGTIASTARRDLGGAVRKQLPLPAGQRLLGAGAQ